MRSTLFIALLYLCLSLLMSSCSDDSTPQPTCLQVEVVGADCESGWYVLQIIEKDTPTTSSYKGQLQSGFVTTDNLPEAYRQPGQQLEVALEVNGEYGPRCLAFMMIYPSVRVKHVCAAGDSSR